MVNEKDNPWETLEVKEVYDNPWIKVKEAQVLTPGKEKGIYGTVHFKNLAIGIVPLDENNNTWIVGQYRYPLKEYSWEIPEGGGKIGIDPIESAKRELREEVGIVAKEWDNILEMDLSNSVSDERAIIYLAKDLTFFEPEPDSNEELVVKKLHFNDLYEMVIKGEIRDSLSVAGVLKLKLLIDKQ